MFFDGNLQDGITKAVEESKLVVCFVSDDGEESRLWRDDFLTEPDLKLYLAQKSVLLHLIAGSAEAAYLAAIFPLPKTPAIVIIHNGQLKEYFAAGLTKEDFSKRMRLVFESDGTLTENQATSHTTETRPDSGDHAMPSTLGQTDSTSLPSETQPNSAQAVLAERSARIAAQKKEQDDKAKKDRMEKVKREREELDKAERSPETMQKSSDIKYALMQKKRQQEAKSERDRILKRVEDDKAERRAKDARRKALTTEGNGTERAESERFISKSSTFRKSQECALQVRLFDGATIRSRFPSQGTLRSDVRRWIDEQQQIGDVPYSFKQVLTPLPNKNISISDEEQSLETLDLTPSATLILVPVKEYTSAYENSGAGLVSKGISTGYGLVSSGVSVVTGVLGGFFGSGPSPAPTQEQPDQSPATMNSDAAINVRTLRDSRRPDDQQLYNGNALNFEPRNDDEDKQK